MKALPRVAALLAAGAMATPATAGPAVQPPMNQFNDAYYTCDDAAFLVSYDSTTPQSATLTTSNNNRTFVLKRTQVSPGVEFSDGRSKFWTDGANVTLVGTVTTYRDCKLKAG